MLATSEPDTLTVVEIEEWHPIPCEGPTHPERLYGHVIAQPASFSVVFPCGQAISMCAGWVQARHRDATETVLCNVGCGGKHLSRELGYIRLD